MRCLVGALQQCRCASFCTKMEVPASKERVMHQFSLAKDEEIYESYKCSLLRESVKYLGWVLCTSDHILFISKDNDAVNAIMAWRDIEKIENSYFGNRFKALKKANEANLMSVYCKTSPTYFIFEDTVLLQKCLLLFQILWKNCSVTAKQHEVGKKQEPLLASTPAWEKLEDFNSPPSAPIALADNVANEETSANPQIVSSKSRWLLQASLNVSPEALFRLFFADNAPHPISLMYTEGAESQPFDLSLGRWNEGGVRVLSYKQQVRQPFGRVVATILQTHTVSFRSENNTSVSVVSQLQGKPCELESSASSEQSNGRGKAEEWDAVVLNNPVTIREFTMSQWVTTKGIPYADTFEMIHYWKIYPTQNEAPQDACKRQRVPLFYGSVSDARNKIHLNGSRRFESGEANKGLPPSWSPNNNNSKNGCTHARHSCTVTVQGVVRILKKSLFVEMITNRCFSESEKYLTTWLSIAEEAVNTKRTNDVEDTPHHERSNSLNHELEDADIAKQTDSHNSMASCLFIGMNRSLTVCRTLPTEATRQAASAFRSLRMQFDSQTVIICLLMIISVQLLWIASLHYSQ